VAARLPGSGSPSNTADMDRDVVEAAATSRLRSQNPTHRHSYRHPHPCFFTARIVRRVRLPDRSPRNNTSLPTITRSYRIAVAKARCLKLHRFLADRLIPKNPAKLQSELGSNPCDLLQALVG